MHEVESLLTIVIPTRNRPTQLAALISGIGARGGLEVVVVDDASDGKSTELNEAVVASVPGARFHRLARRSGAPVARNMGAAISSGRYLWFFDDDDMLPESTLRGVLERLAQSDVEIVLMSSTILQNGQPVAEYRPSLERDTFDEYRRRGQLVSLPCVIMSRSSFVAIGGWDESLLAGQDTDLMLRLARHSEISVWSDLQVHINVGAGPRLTNSLWRQQRAKLQLLRKHWSTFRWSRRFYYMGTFLLVMPFWKQLSGRGVAREILARSSRGSP